MGREGRTLRTDVLLAPQIELSRAPFFSRNKDQTGEDPYLNARLAAAQVDGVQAQGMLAMAKHYPANNQRNGELNRSDPDDPATDFDFRVDDRTPARDLPAGLGGGGPRRRLLGDGGLQPPRRRVEHREPPP
ncbi:glycoside hydrolase family 3 N-terminal domain-containing protein [Streptomyces sp. NPDC051315]|uniref:glycoside hydrolase family 3 N-terminal domain-containing protein n=1 Tax=Streptomyces sp. NPDC051315 TaxID=3365650 RepID=UPI0037A3E6B7